MLFPQPEELTIDEPLERVEMNCGACGADTVFRYRVADYRGWLRVAKCRTCLTTAHSEQIVAPPQGES